VDETDDGYDAELAHWRQDSGHALCLAVAQYYFWDVALQITALQRVYFFAAPPLKV
jgi:hypothetical protein